MLGKRQVEETTEETKRSNHKQAGKERNEGGTNLRSSESTHKGSQQQRTFLVKDVSVLTASSSAFLQPRSNPCRSIAPPSIIESPRIKRTFLLSTRGRDFGSLDSLLWTGTACPTTLYPLEFLGQTRGQDSCIL